MDTEDINTIVGLGTLAPHVQRLALASATTRAALTPVQDWHLMMNLRGSGDKQDLFHYIIGEYDSDYPYTSDVAAEVCKNCGGLVWRAPAFGAKELHQLVQQINSQSKLRGHLRLKLKRFVEKSACKESSKAVGA